MRVFIAVVAAAEALASCSSTSGMGRMNSYKFPVHSVQYGGESYRVYDHKTDNSLMVSPGLGKIVAVGAAQGATLGLVDTMTPEQKLQGAAQQHLNDTGRSQCKVTRGGLLQKPMYEFWFQCPTASASGGNSTGSGSGGVVVGGGS